MSKTRKIKWEPCCMLYRNTKNNRQKIISSRLKVIAPWEQELMYVGEVGMHINKSKSQIAKRKRILEGLGFICWLYSSQKTDCVTKGLI